VTSTLEPRRATPTTLRVAVYTRQSVERHGDQALSSVQAQREKVERYVSSQEGLGWALLRALYDDEGYSGATLSRPALQRLLADVRAGLIDLIVTYRMDRLSRSQRDFLNLLHLFDEHNVRWVSATESFSTARPEGRAMLSVLMAFAQMEREVTSERVRDKVAASRERGLWTGGTPPLGLDSVKGKLVVNEPEAEIVRGIFRLYLETRSISAMVSETAARGWTQKRWTNGHGAVRGGARFTKNALRHLLTNPLYVARIRAGATLHDAQHDAIVDQQLWDAVQAALAERRPEKPQRRKQAWSTLLGGLLRCGCGAGMTHHFASRHGRKYSYYVCAKVVRLNAAACPGGRVRCSDLDAFVMDRLKCIGRDRALAAAVVEAAGDTDVRGVLAQLTPLWDVMHLAERQRVLHLLFEQIRYTARTQDLSFDLRDSGIKTLARELGA
jgi:site-specific DNA recombinase